MTEREALTALRGSDPALAARAERLLWTMWSRSGRADIDELFARGVTAMERQDLGRAEAVFTEIISQAPDFAEGWNKRATVRYLAQNYVGAIADCGQTLARNRHHFGALSGQGLCHLALRQFREAATLFRRALAVHPHLVAVRENLATALVETVKGNGE